MKNSKRWASLTLALLMIASIVPYREKTAYAAESSVSIEDTVPSEPKEEKAEPENNTVEADKKIVENAKNLAEDAKKSTTSQEAKEKLSQAKDELKKVENSKDTEVQKAIEEAEKTIAEAEKSVEKLEKEEAEKKAKEEADKKAEKEKEELEKAKRNAKSEINDLDNLTSSKRREYKEKIEKADKKEEVEKILSDAKKENKKDSTIEIKDIDLYKDAIVVKVNEKDAKVKVSHKKNSTESARASKKVSDKEYIAIIEVKYYNKDDREKAKIIAEKSDFKDSKEYDLDSNKVTTHDEYYLEKNITKVKPSNLELKKDKTKVEGKLEDYKNTKIYVYYEGYEIGSGKTDSKGEFEIKIYDVLGSSKERDLKFYIKENKKEESKKVVITKALAGTKSVEGKDAGKEAEVTVKDSKGNTIGKTTADKDGNFSVSLYRELIAQETITITAKERDKEESKTTYIVPGLAVSKGGYINGYENGTFRPDGKMTRAEAVAMIARLKNGSSDFKTSSITKFIDANNNWYSKALNYAVQKEIIDGYSDGTFKPDTAVTRAEFTKMLSREINGNISSLPFKDTSNHWAKNEIAKAYANNVIKGYEDNTFRPDSNITRAEAVKMLNIVFKVHSSNYTKYFSDVNQNQWFYTEVMNAAN